jgi:AcrR family transcriptional regulator
MAEVGFARFSAREVAKGIGYSIGTLYNVFGSFDGLVLAINARTLSLWAAHLRERLARPGEDRIATLVHGYFDFAADNYNTWAALYDHRLPGGEAAPDWYQALAADLVGIVAGEIAAALPAEAQNKAPPLARSLIATVHGHCMFALNRTFRLLGETAPVEAALARVREAIAAGGG